MRSRLLPMFRSSSGWQCEDISHDLTGNLKLVENANTLQHSTAERRWNITCKPRGSATHGPGNIPAILSEKPASEALKYAAYVRYAARAVVYKMPIKSRRTTTQLT